MNVDQLIYSFRCDDSDINNLDDLSINLIEHQEFIKYSRLLEIVNYDEFNFDDHITKCHGTPSGPRFMKIIKSKIIRSCGAIRENQVEPYFAKLAGNLNTFCKVWTKDELRKNIKYLIHNVNVMLLERIVPLKIELDLYDCISDRLCACYTCYSRKIESDIEYDLYYGIAEFNFLYKKYRKKLLLEPHSFARIIESSVTRGIKVHYNFSDKKGAIIKHYLHRYNKYKKYKIIYKYIYSIIPSLDDRVKCEVENYSCDYIRRKSQMKYCGAPARYPCVTIEYIEK